MPEDDFAPQMFESPIPTFVEEPQEPVSKEPLPQIQARLNPETERIRSELNDTIMANPEEAAKLLTSYIKD